MPRKEKVFVYGTLRPNTPATHKLRDYEMYSLGAYPYIIDTGDTDTGRAVVGTIIEVSKKQLAELDDYENVGVGLYVREKVRVEVIDFTPPWNEREHAVEVWVYVAGPALLPPLIASGDWYNR